MKEHILIERGTRQAFKDSPEVPSGVVYDRKDGFWTMGGEPLLRTDEFKDQPITKKCDQETGEDQKGE